jgi:MoaA/NifB/PqqE/SkfB family radical SAM enzyme
MQAKDINFNKKDPKVRELWDNVSKHMTVSATYYTFDTDDNIKRFEKEQFDSQIDAEKYKWYRREWHRRPKEFDHGEQPLSVICELVSNCNLACNMCYTIKESFKNSVVGANRVLSWPSVKKIIDEAAEMNVPSILFSWRGESTLYKSVHEGKVYTFPDVLKYARDAGILEVTALTHGQLIDELMAEKIVEAKPNWISFSVDGLFDTYNKIRTPRNKKNDVNHNAFKVLIDNIKLLNYYKCIHKSKKPKLRCNTIYPAIANNPMEYYNYMKSAGIDLVSVNELLEWSHYNDDDLPSEAIDLDWGCQYPFQRLTISANGVIVPCNGAVHEEDGLVLGRFKSTPEKKVSLNGKLVVKELTELTLKEAWNCDKLNHIRELHKTKRRIEINPGCRNCNHGLKKKGVSWMPKDWEESSMSWK